MSCLPTSVLTDLWLSSWWIKGLCWVAEVAAGTGTRHTSSLLMGTLHCHKGNRRVSYQFCRFFGLGWGLRSLHSENSDTPKDSDFGLPSISSQGPGWPSAHLSHETRSGVSAQCWQSFQQWAEPDPRTVHVCFGIGNLAPALKEFEATSAAGSFQVSSSCYCK